MSLGDGLLVLLIFWIGSGLVSQDGFSILGFEGMCSWPLPGSSWIIPLEWIMIYGVEWWYRTDAPHSGRCRRRQPGGPDATSPAVDFPRRRDVASLNHEGGLPTMCGSMSETGRWGAQQQAAEARR